MNSIDDSPGPGRREVEPSQRSPVVDAADAAAPHHCPICGSTELRPFKRRPFGQCRDCRAKERTRTAYALLRELRVLDEGRAALHIAPEHALAARLAAAFGGGYRIADINADALERFPVKIARTVFDVAVGTAELAPETFDLVLHNHVMEHVRGSWPLAFLRLHALLRPGGWHVFSLPIQREWSAEDLGELTPRERTRRFGQHDHVRYIGRRDFEQSMATIAALTEAAWFRSAADLLSAEKMRAIAGDRDVFVMRKGAA